MSIRAVRYYSMGETSGYGVAAAAYVRGLVEAGVLVQWQRLQWTAQRPDFGAWRRDDELAPLLACADDATPMHTGLRDLIERTAEPVDAAITIMHSVPDYWPLIFERDPLCRHIGYTAGETDRPAAYRLPLLNQTERVLVPCRMNREDFLRAGVRVPVHVVPHACREAFAAPSAEDIERARRRFGIPVDHRVFYSINTWDPRKALPDLIQAFASAFRADEPVTLLIKTQKTGFGPAPLFMQAPTTQLLAAAIEQFVARAGRPAPNICLIDDELDEHRIDLLHHLGDCYVSLSHGEGWGLGAFDAATLGKPVIMTGWGAQLDYLEAEGNPWPGAVPFRLVAAPIFPARPVYFSNQLWAQADLEGAAALLHGFCADPEPMRTAAIAIRRTILERFSRHAVTRDLLDAIDLPV